jgi:peptidoglycan/xylan/chitin deacetylase (PgdA/CDA1 family)
VRWDRLLSIYCFSPLVRRLMPDRGGIPILMYHSISDELDDHAHPYFQTTTTPSRFAEQLAALKRWGFESVTLSQAISGLLAKDKKTLAHKPVVLTFDDGFRDFYTQAFPLLQRYRFNATVFLATDYIGKSFVTGKPCLNREEIRQLSAQGVEFGSHSASHCRLNALPKTDLLQELCGSRQEIEGMVGGKITLFSYPYGFPETDNAFLEQLTKTLSAEGYQAGVTTILGMGKNTDLPFFLKRLPVNEFDDEALLLAKLEGGYCWLRYPQRFYKTIRAISKRWVRGGYGNFFANNPPCRDKP